MFGKILALLKLVFMAGGKIADEAEDYRRTATALRTGAEEGLEAAQALRAKQAAMLAEAEKLRRDAESLNESIDTLSNRVERLRYGRETDED